MFFNGNKLTPYEQQLKQQLLISQNKGQCYLQLFQSPQTKTHAVKILQQLDKQQLLEIKQHLQHRYSLINHNDIIRCKQYCYEFYYMKKDYLRKTGKRDCALFGIVAFSFINLLCLYGLWKITEYYLMPQESSGKDFEVNSQAGTCGVFDTLLGNLKHSVQNVLKMSNNENSWQQTLSKYGWGTLHFILGSYASFGLWHSTAYFIHCLDIYIYRRNQSKEIKQQMTQFMQRQIQRHQ